MLEQEEILRTGAGGRAVRSPVLLAPQRTLEQNGYNPVPAPRLSLVSRVGPAHFNLVLLLQMTGCLVKTTIGSDQRVLLMFIRSRSVLNRSTGARNSPWLSVGFVAVFFWTVLNVPPGIAAADNALKPGHVLVIFSNSRVLPANIELDRGFRQTLLASRRDAEISTEFLDYPRFAGETYAAVMLAYLREKYALRPPDVVVAVGPDAFEFHLAS